MKTPIIVAAVGIALGLGPAAAQIVNLPPNTVYGNMSPFPSQAGAVTLQTLQSKVFGTERAIADANYSAVTSDRVIAYTSMTAARTVQLVSASAVPPGTIVTVMDRSGSASATVTISISPTGADNINGANVPLSVVQKALGGVQVESDGVSNWTVIGNPAIGTSIPNSQLAPMPSGTVKC